MYACSEARMQDKISTFSKFGDAGHGGITRYSLSPAAIQARNEFVRRMTAIGAVIETDDVANMYATLPGSAPNAQFASYMLPTTMIFVQSKDGLSHCEPEFSSVKHCTEGATVMLNAVLKADKD